MISICIRVFKNQPLKYGRGAINTMKKIKSFLDKKSIIYSWWMFFSAIIFVFAIGIIFSNYVIDNQNIFWVLIVLSTTIIICVVLFLGFLKYNYSLLKRIINCFSHIKEFDGKLPELNEFLQIEEALNKTIEERKKLAKEMVSNEIIVKNTYISKFLRGLVYDSEEKVLDFFSSLGISFDSTNFIVAMFNIDEYFNDILNDEFSVDEIYTTEETNIICKNILEELINNEYKCIVVGVDRNPVCIINLPQDIDEEKAYDILDGIMVKAQDVIEENFHITSSVAISRMYPGIMSVSTAYFETVEIIEYKRSLGNEEYMHIDNFKAEGNTNIYYPLHLEQKLIISVNSGDFNTSKEIVEEIIDKNINENKISLDLIKCLMFSLSNTLLRLINEINTTEEELKFEKNPVDVLSECENIEQFKKKYLNFISKITENFNFKNLAGKHVNKAICYINDNYSDVNLNVQTISNYMGLNAVYFSRIFKAEMKEGLLEYISRLRIDKAKELFLTTDLSVENISLMVGYNDCGTFRRVFKKYTDVTPSKYREIKGKNKK